MIVKMQATGRGVTGLQIGSRNVKRYFTRSVSTVDLDLDQVQIQCELGQSFWRKQPEIADPRLCAWLTAKDSSCKADGSRVVLMMEPAGPNSFRLLAMISAGVKEGRFIRPSGLTHRSRATKTDHRALNRPRAVLLDLLRVRSAIISSFL